MNNQLDKLIWSILLIFLQSTLSFGIETDDSIYKGVVKIINSSPYETDETGKIGTGIIISQNKDKIYIATAAHVVSYDGEIMVYFYRNNEPVKASLYRKDVGLDLAVLEVSTDFKAMRVLEFSIASMSPEMKVSVIGHPFNERDDFRFFVDEQVQETGFLKEPFRMTITRNQIKTGCSGGPVFDKSNNWLGMITSIDQLDTYCLKSEFIVRWAHEEWNIPISYELSPKVSSKGLESSLEFHFLAGKGAVREGLPYKVSARMMPPLYATLSGDFTLNFWLKDESPIFNDTTNYSIFYVAIDPKNNPNQHTSGIWMYKRRQDGNYSIFFKNQLNAKIDRSNVIGPTYKVLPGKSGKGDGIWKNFSITYSKETGEIKMYINGREQKNIGNKSRLTMSQYLIKDAKFVIGASHKLTAPWKGDIRDFKIFSKKLSVQEMQKLTKEK